MRFMMLMIPKGYETAAPGTMPPAEAVAAMMKYNEAAERCRRADHARRAASAIDGRAGFVSGGKPVVTDGPFTEAKEVLGGYWMIEVKSRDEAIAWAKRCPASGNEIIEIRQVQEMADFPADVQAGGGRILTELQGKLGVKPVPLVTFTPGSCKSLSHELAQGTAPRRARLSSRQSERGAAAGGARPDRRKGRGRVHLCRCRADGRRQPRGALPAFSRSRRTAFQHCATRLRAVRGGA